jgi:hypothetical protein
LATKRESNIVVIKKAQSEITSRVKSYDVAPDVPNKSDWLEQAFADSNEETGGDGLSAKTLKKPATVVDMSAAKSRKTAKRPAHYVQKNQSDLICNYA